ncbi:hypothetical protein GCM10027445_61900 [Amycolatopsis endophytica]|uniref:Guanylate cyclase domain-containing protein n=1 Tax=Amycolatopsis endophytica TaxID=860233 RepID=A0A853B4I7_9PSEU|nr:hypothetical protein [Amycolatopsis endophytica]NYI89661.1 hypothetical protein [Amycolatopsis endophytica]
MTVMPESRVLLGVDVIGSAAQPGHYRRALWAALNRMLEAALSESGIGPEEVIDHEYTGDGALYTLPSTRLGSVVDLTQYLERRAGEHNRWHRPDLRLRLAVEVGAVGDSPGYYGPKISHSRLLNAGAFRRVLGRCLEEGDSEAPNTGLILSGAAFRETFAADYVHSVRRAEFAELTIHEKEFREQAWIRVPGFDARTLTAFSQPLPAPQPSASARGEHPQSVHNQVNGIMRGLQAGVIHGSVTFGEGSL